MEFTPASSFQPQPKPAGKIIGILVAIVVILVAIAIVLVLRQNGNFGQTTSKVTDAQKAQILKDLMAQTASAPVVTDAQKAQILESLNNGQ